MKVTNDLSKMQAGIYRIEMKNKEQADKLIRQFKDCPNWPVVTNGIKEK